MHNLHFNAYYARSVHNNTWGVYYCIIDVIGVMCKIMSFAKNTPKLQKKKSKQQLLKIASEQDTTNCENYANIMQKLPATIMHITHFMSFTQFMAALTRPGPEHAGRPPQRHEDLGQQVTDSSVSSWHVSVQRDPLQVEDCGNAAASPACTLCGHAALRPQRLWRMCSVSVLH